MKAYILAALCLSSCAVPAQRGLQTQDCITTHVKSITRNTQETMTGELYDKIVEACGRIFDGRP